MGLEYVDVFYSHRFDPDTPLEETMGALDAAVRQGKALYAGISSYSAEQTRQAARILHELGTPCVIHQPVYNMFNRWVEPELLGTLEQEGIGCISFSPLAQGLLTNRYLHGIPADSRAGSGHGFLRPEHVTEQRVAQAQALGRVAEARGQSLAQMALAWVLRHPGMTSVLIGASRVQQIDDNVGALANLAFTDAELAEIDTILSGK
jgi:L-glyceraldehyde 3-phosphate reductase